MFPIVLKTLRSRNRGMMLQAKSPPLRLIHHVEALIPVLAGLLKIMGKQKRLEIVWSLLKAWTLESQGPRFCTDPDLAFYAVNQCWKMSVSFFIIETDKKKGLRKI